MVAENVRGGRNLEILRKVCDRLCKIRAEFSVKFITNKDWEISSKEDDLLHIFDAVVKESITFGVRDPA